MGEILLLDEATVNKIAAGEVIERPASVIKELVENALDAGALHVDIEVKGGGLEEICVVDDGCGMSAEDALLSLERHATSKIRSAEDLAHVATMGFRGEALPSIAAVAKMTLTTRRSCDLAGTRIEVHGGKIVGQSEAGSPAGTQVQVRDLFFNTPARLKFVKSEGAETAKIADTVQRLALSRPDVSFRLTVNGKPRLATTGSKSLADTAHQVYGRALSRYFLPFTWQGNLLSLSGLVSHPSLARANRNMQTFFVNRRHVRSPLLADALQAAYSTLLPRNRFPAAVIFVSIDSREVDVNVHPAKREVRFSREREVYREFLSGIKAGLKSHSLLAQIPQAERATFFVREREHPVYVQEKVFPPAWRESAAALPQAKERVELPAAGKEEPEKLPARKSMPENTPGKAPALAFIGQSKSGYLLAEKEDGTLCIVDPHAAHERVLFDLLCEDMEKYESLPSQEIIPQKMQFDVQTAAKVTERLKKFRQVGLTLEPFGNNTFILRTIPAFFHRSLSQAEIARLVEEACSDDAPQTLLELLKTMACKAAVKLTQRLSGEEAASLLRNLAATANPYTCPHGRPTVLSMDKEKLDGYFRRS